jgi:ribosomal protein S18 acetylase RimI-like enzyme
VAASFSPLRIEAACLSAWPAIGVAHDGAWLWRFAHGYSKRSNSFQSLDPADIEDAEARILRLADLSRRHAVEPVFRVTPLAGAPVVETLDRMGWAAFDESAVLAMELGGRAFDPGAEIRAFDPADPRWCRVQATLGGASPQDAETMKTLYGLIAPEAKGLVVYDRGTPAAAALAVNAGGIGVYLNVVTDRARRRRGHGAAAMRAALDWTARSGASIAAIQVQADNEPALALYRSLGFAERYRYHYRSPA